jgi:hypothetical protein
MLRISRHRLCEVFLAFHSEEFELEHGSSLIALRPGVHEMEDSVV